jgi:hypothetical protein
MDWGMSKTAWSDTEVPDPAGGVQEKNAADPKQKTIAHEKIRIFSTRNLPRSQNKSRNRI